MLERARRVRPGEEQRCLLTKSWRRCRRGRSCRWKLVFLRGRVPPYLGWCDRCVSQRVSRATRVPVIVRHTYFITGDLNIRFECPYGWLMRRITRWHSRRRCHQRLWETARCSRPRMVVWASHAAPTDTPIYRIDHS